MRRAREPARGPAHQQCTQALAPPDSGPPHAIAERRAFLQARDTIERRQEREREKERQEEAAADEKRRKLKQMFDRL